MKRNSLILIFLITIMSFTVSCRDAEKEVVVKEKVIVKEVEVEKVEDKEGILERSAKKIDKKVNEEIDQEIDNIVNDN